MTKPCNFPCASPAEKQSTLAHDCPEVYDPPKFDGRLQGHPGILVVDDEALIADTITKILSSQGYAVTAAYDAESALESALLAPPHLLLSDVFLPGMNGIELAETITRIYPDCRVLLFSGQASSLDWMAPAARASRCFTLLKKPVPPQELLALVANQLNPVSEMAAVAQEASYDRIAGE